MSRIYNFSAGPAVLPEAVLREAQESMLDWQGCGLSVMEMSHRGKEFITIAARAEQDLRDLLRVPDSHRILFLQGGATGQFAAIPMNLLSGRACADYVDTGNWSKKAIAEAKKHCTVNVVATGGDGDPMSIPPQADWRPSPDAAYLHYTPNETISGVEFHWVPQVEQVPLVADMSSTLLSRPIDVARFGLIYAGAQKNIGPAGLTVVIVREDLIGKAMPATPAVWDYRRQSEADSMLNTPPTYAWYIAGLVFQWLKRQGGLEAMAQVNKRKADKLYAAIDGSDFYRNPVHPACRSWMNVPFVMAEKTLDERFLAAAKSEGLLALKGHRSVGGMRASLYNAMPEAGVDALIAFMRDFEQRYG
ncbi:MAG: 3-phosphoserine/phosphohydroxythreonine transaminase [Nitrococcus mobilis]|nr:3-phosphoserine/phosphohydroxythreonine transaminase [Nitrococcus mobilis]